MTATVVNGHAVLATEQVETPLSKPGRPMHFKNLVRLLLANGAERYGCTHCDYVGVAPQTVNTHVSKAHGIGGRPGVRPGRKVEGGSNAPRAGAGSVTQNMTLAELVTAAQQVDALTESLFAMTADRNRLKAENAELRREKRTIEKRWAAFNSMMGGAR